MMTGAVRIQSVLYRNDREELRRSLRAIDQAAIQAGKKGWSVSLQWGDASEKPLFSDTEWQEFRRAGRHLASAEYSVFHSNTGYGKGNNLLSKNGHEDFLLIMNPEILLPPNVVIDLLSPFCDPEVGLTEARQIPVEHPKVYDKITLETEWSSGACFMISRKLFEDLQGFDTRTFFMYCEDVDLSWRVRMFGKKLYYQPLAGVDHSRRLSERGRNLASKTEMTYTVLSEALLAYKWSYPEYARERIRLAAERGDPGSQEALTAFRKLEYEGRLPSFLDPEHRIAHIIQYPESGGMLFTRHQYSL